MTDWPGEHSRPVAPATARPAGRSGGAPARAASTRSPRRSTGSSVISRFRPDCLHASTIVRRSRSSFDARGSTTERSVTRGMRRSTPISVAFSTSQSNRSPLGMAVARVSEQGGRASGIGSPSATSSTRSLPTSTTRAMRRESLPVEELDEVARDVPGDAGEVPGLLGAEPEPAVPGRIGAIEPTGHGMLRIGSRDGEHLIRSSRKDEAWTWPIVGLDALRRTGPSSEVARRPELRMPGGGDTRRVERSLGIERPTRFPDRDALFVPLAGAPGGGGAAGPRDRGGASAGGPDAGHRAWGRPGCSGRRWPRRGTPSRRFALVSGPADAASLFGGLADGLRLRAAVGRSSPAACWRALEQAIRICACQGTHVVLAVDDCQTLIAAGGDRRPPAAGPARQRRRGSVTVLLVDGRADRQDQLPEADWTLAVRLEAADADGGRGLSRRAAGRGRRRRFPLHRACDRPPAPPLRRHPARAGSARLAVPDGGGEPRAGGRLVGAGRRRRRRMPSPRGSLPSPMSRSRHDPPGRESAAGMRPWAGRGRFPPAVRASIGP